jgi:tetratricopeptide (TPR) repeat protein
VTPGLRLAAVLAALCAGCAARPQAPLPPAQERIAAASARGAALARAGDHAAAALKFQEALRTAGSIEDADAVAASAISLSIVYQRLGHHAAARSALALVLDAPGRFPEARVLQAELRQAIVELSAGDAADAAAFAQRAGERCRRLSCELAGAILNVQAGAALDAGDGPASLAFAQAAEAAARARADRVETANALRNIGRARVRLGEAAAAIPALEQALEIDRALADSRKIVADLAELERASSAAGDAQAARRYAERALAISRAARETPGEETEVRLR